MSYYQKKQFLARVNTENEIVGTVEKWKAHEEGILHRGFTVALLYKNQFILQHRKHPAFNGYFDLTCSSHPVYINEQPQQNEDAVFEALKREWNIEKFLVKNIKLLGSVVYKAKDMRSGYTEHEFCLLYQGEVNTLPLPDFEYAYGFSLADKKQLADNTFPTESLLVPWVKTFVEKGLI